ncbi:MAG TPA: PEGA domain-containing protein [Thermoanaerobaculia bacterium]|nr:PEGA domain-containing protein [Thermoanaerobaculia bacterium]
MKKKMLLLAAIVALALPAASAVAAPRASGRGGFHGGGFRSGFRPYYGFYGGPSWGYRWGWYGWPAYYGYYGYYRGPNGYIAANWASVKTDVSPDEARVYLDGKYIGTADDFDGWPDKLYLRPGHYRLEFRLSGYEPKVVEVDARRGTELKIDDKLRKAPPGARSESDPPKIEGDVPRFYGKRSDRDIARPYGRQDEDADEDFDSDDRRPARYRDRDERDDADRAPARRSEDTWRRGTRRPDASISTRPDGRDRSRLRITAEPSDAAVYLDDRFVGSADELASMERGIVVSPGKHTVTVSRPGYRDRTADVQVDAGKTESVKVSLSR